MITPILKIEGHGGVPLLQYDNGGKRLTFFWDRKQNAHVAKFKDRQEWLAAQKTIAAARVANWVVIADYLEGEVDTAPPVNPPTPSPEQPISIHQTEFAPTPELPPEPIEVGTDPVQPSEEPSTVDSDQAFEVRVQQLIDSMSVSQLRERAKDLQIPGRAALTTQDKLARAIATAEKEG